MSIFWGILQDVHLLTELDGGCSQIEAALENCCVLATTNLRRFHHRLH